MPRYVVRKPRSDDDSDFYFAATMLPELTVEESVSETGLFDPSGNKLFRQSDEIGFLVGRPKTKRFRRKKLCPPCG